MDRAVLLVIVCVYETKKTFYKITWHQQDLSYVDQHGRDESPSSPRAATCNSSQEIEIYLFVKSPLILEILEQTDTILCVL